MTLNNGTSLLYIRSLVCDVNERQDSVVSVDFSVVNIVYKFAVAEVIACGGVNDSQVREICSFCTLQCNCVVNSTKYD